MVARLCDCDSVIFYADVLGIFRDYVSCQEVKLLKIELGNRLMGQRVLRRSPDINAIA